MIGILSDKLLALVFPQRCQVCDSPVERFADGVCCKDCWDNFRPIDPADSPCLKCSVPSTVPSAGAAIDCAVCRDHQYRKARAVGVFDSALAAAIIELKSRPTIPKVIREHLRTVSAREADPTIDLIVPVPLSKRRLRERGFNQASVIADVVAKMINVNVDGGSLVRDIHTPLHRAGMDRRQREATVENAFRVARPRLIEGKRILLVDDVFTSGSTVSHCARVLKENGAGEVDVLTLARAVLSKRFLAGSTVRRNAR